MHDVYNQPCTEAMRANAGMQEGNLILKSECRWRWHVMHTVWAELELVLTAAAAAAAATSCLTTSGYVAGRHIHATSMVLNKDREALAEEWHQLLCLLDPTHPE